MPFSTMHYFRSDIQGLRALAVIFVVLYHTKVPFFTGGYVGVDIFFVISGYLITSLLMQDLKNFNRINLAIFYARRIRRLLPAATVVFIATAIFSRVWLSPLEQLELAPSILYSALYVSNIWFGLEATDYLAADINTNPLLHTWSLSVEEQFYLAWPLLMVLGAYTNSESKRRIWLASMMITIFVISLAFTLWVIRISQPWAFFGSPMRAWEFAVGGLASIASCHFKRFSSTVKDGLFIAGLGFMIGAVVLFDDQTQFPGLMALLPVTGAALALLAGVGTQGRIAPWLYDNVLVQMIGNLSYSWYLWHWPILVFAGMTATPSTLLDRFGYVLASLVLAGLTYTVVENPVRFSAMLTQAPWRSLTLGASLVMAGSGSALTLLQAANSTLATPEQTLFIRARTDLPKVYADECHLPHSIMDSPKCTYGNPLGSKTVILFGDSRAAQWFPALEQIAQQQDWRLISLTKSACPSVWVTPYNVTLMRDYEECAHWRSAVVKRIIAESPTLVILANYSSYYMQGLRAIGADEWRIGMRRTLNEIRHSGAFILVFRDTPQPAFDVPTCLSRALWRSEDIALTCSFSRENLLNKQAFEIEKAAAKEMDGTAVLDLSDLVCNGTVCQSIIDGKIGYRDSHHLTATASAYLASNLFIRMVEEKK